MARLSPEIQRNFTGGEQSPEMDARADIPRWRTALQTLENMVAMIRGLVTRRSGFLDIHAAFEQSVLREFAFSDSDAYAIEFGVGETHFFRDYGILESAPGVPYLKANPFTAPELDDIDTAQSADTLYITTGARPPQQMKRVAQTNWTFADAVFRGGPFLDENADKAITITSDAGVDMEPGTSFNLTASASIFQTGHVGALFKLKAEDQAMFGKWAGPDSSAFTVDKRVYWGDNFYRADAVHGTKTGSAPPIHLVGSAWDGSNVGGDNAVSWAYKHSGFGVARITAYVSATEVTAEALTYIPDEIALAGTWRWSEGAFSDYRGWPRFCGLHDSRLHLMSTTTDPTRGWASVTDDFTNFDASHPDEDTAAFSYRLGGNRGKVNFPRFLCAADRLVIGTAGDEHVLLSANGETLAPDNFKIVTPTTEGAAAADALRIEDVVFISADGERLLEMAGDTNSVRQDAYVCNDLTLYADHISGGGFTKFVWQREPYRLIWALRADGTLAACTYRRDQNVLAWSRQPTIKGVVQDICAVPSPAKKRQDLWAIVSRTLAGGTVRRVECLAPFFQKGGKDVTAALFVDSASQYSGAATTSIPGLSRLNGEQVSVLADGKVVRGLTVSGGVLTLPKAASKVTVGLPMTARLRTLRCDKDSAGGALSVKPVRVSELKIDVMDSAGVSAFTGEPADDKKPQLLMPSGGAVSDAAARLYTGVLKIEALESAWADGDVSLICDTPLPATIRAITAPYQVAR